MEEQGDMKLTDRFNLTRPDPTGLDRESAYANMTTHNPIESKFNRTDERLRQQKKEAEKKRNEETIDDLAALAEETIRQAYEDFQANYEDTMAFYDDTDERLDDLEERINGRLQEMESKTELLTDDNGNAAYQDENGGFYKVENGQRVAIIAEEEVASLKEKVRDIKTSGQSVRTESEQGIFVQLQLALTDTMDIRRDAGRNRDEAEGLNREVERDHSKSPVASERLYKGRDDIEKRMKEMEERVDNLDAKTNDVDHEQTADQNPEADLIDSNKSTFSNNAPDTGFGLS